MIFALFKTFIPIIYHAVRQFRKIRKKIAARIHLRIFSNTATTTILSLNYYSTCGYVILVHIIFYAGTRGRGQIVETDRTYTVLI